MTHLRKLVTVGVYGWTSPTFLEAIEAAEVDVLVDVRARRGVRGAEYAWANHKRLVASLEVHGIDYVHMRELAPTADVRSIQAVADAQSDTAKRARRELSAAFRYAYQTCVLDRVDLADVVGSISAYGRVPCLLCVERLPEGCHRSLAADALTGIAVSTPVAHLLP